MNNIEKELVEAKQRLELNYNSVDKCAKQREEMQKTMNELIAEQLKIQGQIEVLERLKNNDKPGE